MMRVSAITLPARDRERLRAYYESALGPYAQSTTSVAIEFGEGERGGAPIPTVEVDALDAVLARAAIAGATIVARPDERSAVILDPDGNALALVER